MQLLFGTVKIECSCLPQSSLGAVLYLLNILSIRTYLIKKPIEIKFKLERRSSNWIIANGPFYDDSYESYPASVRIRYRYSAIGMNG